MREIARSVGIFFLWNLAVSAALLALPPPAAVGAMLVLFVLYCGWLIRSDGADGAPARLGGVPRGAAAPLALAVPVLFALQLALGTVWAGLVPVPPEAYDPFAPLTGTPGGRLAVSLYAVAVAPLVEELVFRGRVQGVLERWYSPATAVSLAALLFAAIHLNPHLLPALWVLGAAFGFVVWATGSLRAAFALHAAHNALTLVAQAAFGAPGEEATIWETGPTVEWWGALVLLAASAWAAWRLAAALRRAGR